VHLTGQQTQQYSLYMFDKYQYNPAYAGLDYALSVNVHTRNQWNGLPQSPTFMGVNAHMPFYLWSGAIGVKASTRSLGVQRHSEISGSYNYVLDLGNGLWSNGVSVGMSYLGIDGAAIVTPDGVYTGGSVNHGDPKLPTSGDVGLGLLWEAGTYYKARSFEGGVTVSGMPGNNVGLDGFTFEKRIHISAYGQYVFQIFGEFDLLQSILLKSNFGSLQTDISSVVRINGNIFGGVGVRGYSSSSLDAVMVLFGVDLTKHMTLTYSYDAGISGLRQVNEGSHELHFNYDIQKIFGKALPPKIIYNPRYL